MFDMGGVLRDAAFFCAVGSSQAIGKPALNQ